MQSLGSDLHLLLWSGACYAQVLVLARVTVALEVVVIRRGVGLPFVTEEKVLHYQPAFALPERGLRSQ
jgi:hypothetical protein